MTDVVGTERQFRLLLLAYPRSYRRHYGDEILTTLMEAAGNGRPSAAEMRDLVVGGLRQRFRLPYGRLMVVAAVLAALTAGGLGAALGSLAGWQTATRMPDDAGIRALTTIGSGAPFTDEVYREPNPLLRPPGASAMTPTDVAGWQPEAVADQLTAAGWAVDPYQTLPSKGAHFTPNPDGTLREIATDVTQIVAVRGGLALEVLGFTNRSGPAEMVGRSVVQVRVEPERPVAALPLTVAGALAGLVAGWLLAARAGYRLRRLSLPRRLPALVCAAGAAAVLAPITVATFRQLGLEIGAAAGPSPVDWERFVTLPTSYHYTFSFTYGWNAAAGIAAALIGMVLILVIRPVRESAPEEA